jgi:hypothetical protein
MSDIKPATSCAEASVAMLSLPRADVGDGCIGSRTDEAKLDDEEDDPDAGVWPQGLAGNFLSEFEIVLPAQCASSGRSWSRGRFRFCGVTDLLIRKATSSTCLPGIARRAGTRPGQAVRSNTTELEPATFMKNEYNKHTMDNALTGGAITLLSHIARWSPR